MLSLIAYAVAATAAQPATVKSGVDHWRAGEYAAAVAAWLPFAAQGDPDACFNLGQAYKLGRGVAKDPAVARDYYRRAATKGHLPAQANLGIALFQAGDKAEAVRWLKQAADRGEPRAQYVLGIAAYNGDGTPKNLGLAYGYLLRAQASGLAQATTAMASIEPVLKPADRSAGTAMAASLAAGTGVPAALAAASTPPAGPAGVLRPGSAPAPSMMATAMSNVRNALGLAPPPVAAKPPTTRAPVQTADASPGLRAPAARATGDGFPTSRTTGDGLPVSTPKLPAIAAADVPVRQPAPASAAPNPAVAAPVTRNGGDTALADATPAPAASGTTTAASIQTVPLPAGQSADSSHSAPVAQKPVVAPAAPPKPVNPKPSVEAKPVVSAAAADAKPGLPKSAGWRVQLGAFSTQKQADAAWTALKSSQSGAIGKVKPIFDASGPVVKFQLGPYASRDAARDTCAKLAFAGRACFVTQG